MSEVLRYKPPPIAKEFIKRYLPGELFYDWIVGPYGSAKTTAMFFKLVYMAGLQAPSPDGIRYSRAVVVRNTLPQLRDSTLVSWNYWFQDGIHGEWQASKNDFILRVGDIHCTTMFRPLDTPADVQRVLGLEVTFAIVDEFCEMRRIVQEGLSGRLGRYKPPGDVGCTNWGMWGASNPGTEDLWWYDYLHGKRNEETGLREGCVPILFPHDVIAQTTYETEQGFATADVLAPDGSHIANAWYYKQPSGFAENAENIENLPGKRAYYTNLAKGKSKEWIKQYIEAEWGFTAGGQPIAKSFESDLHIAKKELPFNPNLKLVVGVDPGLGGSAFIFMQQRLDGRVYVLGEVIARGIGAKRMLMEKVRPYIRARFPEAQVMLAPDPAAANRSPNDEKQIVQTLKEFYPVSIETNNRLPLRLNAIDHYCNTLIDGVPALQIDPVHCPVLLRALRGGWRWALNPKTGQFKSEEAEDNEFTHPGDAFGYGLRYYHKGVEREERQSIRRFTAPVYRGNPYHVR